MNWRLSYQKFEEFLAALSRDPKEKPRLRALLHRQSIIDEHIVLENGRARFDVAAYLSTEEGAKRLEAMANERPEVFQEDQDVPIQKEVSVTQHCIDSRNAEGRQGRATIEGLQVPTMHSLSPDQADRALERLRECLGANHQDAIDLIESYRKQARGDNVTPYQKIMRAAKLGIELQLTAEEVACLALNSTIEAIAMDDDDLERLAEETTANTGERK